MGIVGGGGLGAVVHIVATIEFPVVIFRAPAVHAVKDVSVNAHGALVLACLIHHAGSQIHQLGEIATVKYEVVNLFAGDGAGEIGRGSLDLGHAFAGYLDYVGDSTYVQLHVDANLVGDLQHDFGGRVFLESFCGHGDVVGGAGQTGDDVGTVRVRSGGARQTACRICDHYFGADNRST